jgi:hypothetical protein
LGGIISNHLAQNQRKVILNLIRVTRISRNWYMGLGFFVGSLLILHNFSYGCPWTISCPSIIISFPNLTSFLITTSYPYNYLALFFYNYLVLFLITISYPYTYFILFLTHQHGYQKKHISICLFMSMIFILIEIKFDIDINNDELLIIIWEHNKEENCHS